MKNKKSHKDDQHHFIMTASSQRVFGSMGILHNRACLSHFLFFILYLLFPALLSAQSVQWEPSSGSLARDQVSRLNLVFENCKPKSDIVALPKINGLQVGDPSTNSSVSINFGSGQGSNSRSTTTLTYPVRPAVADKIVIPSFQIETNEGTLTVPSATFTIGEPTVGGGQLRLQDVANSRLALPDRAVWAGEVFPVSYKLYLAERYAPRLTGVPEWSSTPLILEDWPQKANVTGEMLNGQSFAIAGYEVRAFSPQAGTFSLPSLTQSVALATGRSVWGTDYGQYNIRTNPVSITVKPLPQPAPATFSGAVGQFTLKAKAVPEKVAVGEPITWTLELSGTGNWSAVNTLPQRNVSKDFRVVQPRAQKTNHPGTLFDASLAEDVVLIPTKPGKYQLGPVGVSVFNPVKGVYEVLHAEPITVEILPAANGTTSAAITGNASVPSAGASTPSPSVGNLTVPPEPAAIPRDPLSPVAPAAAPVEFPARLPWLLVSGLWPFLGWLVLAYRRARLTDPLLPRRQARQRLIKTLSLLPRQMTSSNVGDRQSLNLLLLAWQKDAAILWGIGAAVPNARQFKNERWANLWRDADRVLYHRDAPLPENWLVQARQALAEAHLPGFKLGSLFLGRNLFPFVALVLATLLVIAATTTANAAEPTAASSKPMEAYKAADFLAAEQGWREQVKESPTDWSAHYNLSLALAQQDRWGESAANATVAFVQHPRDPAVRWQLHLALGKGGYLPEPLKPFANETPQASLAGLCSPAEWQHLLYGGVFLVAAGIMLALLCGYRFCGKLVLILSGISLFAGSIVIVTSLYSQRTYGLLADEHAAIVWKATTLYSVPTEADEEQKTTPVSAGSIVLVQKDYLGWRRVEFPNGQTGWIRVDSLTSVWE